MEIYHKNKQRGSGVVKMNRTASTVQITSRLREYVINHPDADRDEVMQAVGIGSIASLYSILAGLNDDR